jgi:hypothetical protein
VEWSILAACFAAFILMYMLFTKVFPIVSIWEVQEGREKSIAEVTERLKSYLPEPNVPAASRESAGVTK